MPPLKLVEGTASFSTLTSNPPKHKQPAAYVMLLGDDGGENRVATGVSQRVIERFGVLIAFGNVGDVRGEAAAKAIETDRDTIRTKLLGWQPTANHGAVQFVRGRLVGLRNGVVWWQDEFRSNSYLQDL